jgi:hypothetical protein
MITTFRAMRWSFAKIAIIGLLWALLAGCSAVRLSYNNGPQLAWWWLDGYLDFPSSQVPRAKELMGRWFDWHRATQLPEYAAVLASAQQQIGEPTTAAQVCRWQALVRDRLEHALERAMSDLAGVLPSLGEPQWRHVEQRFAKANEELRSDFLQPRAEARAKASVQRAVDRAEGLYGRLDEAQRRVIAQGVAASPFDPDAWLAERQRRQADVVQTLRRLSAERAEPDQWLAAVRVLVERAERSPDPGYRAYQQKLADYNCAFLARLHNATTPAQRLAARERLKGWEEDLRSLINAP